MLLVQLMFDDIHIHVIVAVVIFVSGPQASYEWSRSGFVSSAAAHVPAWHEAWHHQNSSRLQVSNVDCDTDQLINESEADEVILSEEYLRETCSMQLFVSSVTVMLWK